MWHDEACCFYEPSIWTPVPPKRSHKGAENERVKGFRRWAFTDYSHNANDKDVFNDARVNQLEYSWELCPQTGRLHKQGRIEFFEPQRRSVVWELLKNDCHSKFEQFESSHKEYVNDPTKAGWLGHVVHGPKKEKKQGERVDIKAAFNDIKEGKSTRDVMENHTPIYLKYSRAVEKMVEEFSKEPEYKKIKVMVLWGKSGSGKSHYPYCKHPGEVYRLTQNDWDTKFFNGYRGQRVLLMDDFDGSWMKFSTFKTFIDGYNQKVNTKGAWRWAQWDTIYITSNSGPKTWWKNVVNSNPEEMSALKRRITEVHHIKDVIECPHKIGKRTCPRS